MSVETTGDLGDLLGIWAHPDDEAWLSAGLMMRAVANGRQVTCVTATKGEAGFPSEDTRSEQERASVRESELARCLQILGVSNHRWLGFGDGRCAEVPDDRVVPGLTELIRDLRPRTVLTFGPDGGTGHTDHIAACRWATKAVRVSGVSDVRLLYATKTAAWSDLFIGALDPATVMMTDDLEPETTDESELAVWFSCDDEELTRKVDAMRAQESQIEPMYQMLGDETFRAIVREEFFRLPRDSDPF
jgi:LmbE family N-acetylglucosaminyl deacetylase